MDNNAPRHIVNELLPYVFCYYDADSLNELRTTIDHFYTSDSVVSAKNLLWEHYSEQLQLWNFVLFVLTISLLEAHHVTLMT